MITQYLAVAGIVFALNLLPAFGPPTWAVLVLLKLQWHLEPVPLVLIGASAAGAGGLSSPWPPDTFETDFPPSQWRTCRPMALT